MSDIDLSVLTTPARPNRKVRRWQERFEKRAIKKYRRNMVREHAAAGAFAAFGDGKRAILSLGRGNALVLDRDETPSVRVVADVNRTSLTQHERVVANRYGIDPGTFTDTGDA